MNNGNAFICFNVLVCCLLFSSCDSHRRFGRLVTKHPELLQEITKTDVVVRTEQVHDTLVYFNRSTDTIHTEYATIYRTADTIRLITRERPCTTYVTNTQVIPQIKEKKERKGSVLQVIESFRTTLAITFGILLLLLAFKLISK